jgi:diketogulonate reductase-like aldo/keto reductase
VEARGGGRMTPQGTQPDVPSLIYGTAWKEEQTAPLVKLALQTGFRGVDTANQRLHYHEAAVGEAVRAAGLDGIFLQTKFTHLDGQDERLPYDRDATVATQVAQSIESSLQHLRVSSIDSYLLHGPSARDRLTREDWDAWKAMEAAQLAGKVGRIGISNVTLGQLEELHRNASMKPAVVQNRCFARTGWDRAVRKFCAAHGIVYQGFSLLTANPEVLRHPAVRAISARIAKTTAQVVFRFAIQIGMVALTGTTDPQHMAVDLAVERFALEADEVSALERLMG